MAESVDCTYSQVERYRQQPQSAQPILASSVTEEEEYRTMDDTTHQEDLIRQGPRGGLGYRPYHEVGGFNLLRNCIMWIAEFPECPTRNFNLILLGVAWAFVQQELQKNMEDNLACPKCGVMEGESDHIQTEELAQVEKELMEDMAEVPGVYLTLEDLDSICECWWSLEHNILMENFHSKCDGLWWKGNPGPGHNFDDGKAASTGGQER